MSKKSAPEVSRREFLGSACCAAVGATGLLSTLGSLRLMGAAASPGNGAKQHQRSYGEHAPRNCAVIGIVFQGHANIKAEQVSPRRAVCSVGKGGIFVDLHPVFMW